MFFFFKVPLLFDLTSYIVSNVRYKYMTQKLRILIHGKTDDVQKGKSRRLTINVITSLWAGLLCFDSRQGLKRNTFLYVTMC